MTALPLASVAPLNAAQAYGRVEAGGATIGNDAAANAQGFGATLQRAMQSVVDSGTQADNLAAQAVSGHANLTEVVTAVSQAELAMQTTMAIRDRVVSAYQDIMHMAI